MIARRTEAAAVEDTLRSLYRIAPEMARSRHAAATVDRNPADPHRATVLVGAEEADLLPFAAEHALGGPRGGATPADLLCAALAASQDSALRLAAARHGVRIASLGVEVTSAVDVRGALGAEDDVPVGFQALHSTVRIETAPDTSAQALRQVLADADRACIVLATLRRALPVYVRIQHQTPAPLALAA
ncbi:MAG: OsmC family protein [Burkholderiales bacterium]